MTRSTEETTSGGESQSRVESTPIAKAGDATTGTHEQTLSFTLHGEPDPIRPARQAMSQIQNARVREQLDELLLTLRNMLGVIQQVRGDLGQIPALRVSPGDGESVLVEWVFPNFRIGFNIEADAENSGWHLVSNKNLDELTASGYLRNMQEVVALLLDFILANV